VEAGSVTASIFAPPRSDVAIRGPLHRETLFGAREGRLYFAQVREDPLLEIEALAPHAARRIVAVSSGGCTTLSLLAAGAGQVIAVDLNATQNHLVELKAAALVSLSLADAIAFLGGTPAPERSRLATFKRLRRGLSPSARTYWDQHHAMIGSGVLGSGVTERLIRLIVAAVRAGIHPRSRIQRLLGCRTLEEQRSLYEREWNTRRWRLLFTVLLNRWVFSRTYEPEFFQYVRNLSFAEHFHRLVEHGLTQLRVETNYFLHHMLTGAYPVGTVGGVPPYLTEEGAGAVRVRRDRLSLVDGSYTACLRDLPDASVDGFALSNICEWLSDDGIDLLFTEIARTAAPGATLCFRNFVGWTEIPTRWRRRIVEDQARSRELSTRDRSLIQPRIAVCRILEDQ
jgi:S-adenosylmethionine-diacylglycerol 3-amino-3-carboxypropyl transferase